MAALGESLTVTRRCAQCGASFRLQLWEIGNGDSGRMCCGPDCKRAHTRARKRQVVTGTCRACGWNITADMPNRYQLGLCVGCQHVAYRSCWRKVQFRTGEQALANYPPGAVGGVYECPLCGFMHPTRVAADDPVCAEYSDRVRVLGVYLRGIGFDINAARGWVRQPGNHAADA